MFILPVNLGDFSEAAKLLIEKVSDALGGLAGPWQTRRMARAEVDADIMRANGDIRISAMQERAYYRSLQERDLHQLNMESIVGQAIPLLDTSSDPSKIDNDWATNYLDKCRLISESQMQDLWARILAGEANSPGKYSKRTVNFLTNFDKNDADMFSILCRFIWNEDGPYPLVFNHNDSVYKDHGLSFEVLTHLESIGILRFSEGFLGLGGYVRDDLHSNIKFDYFGRLLTISVTAEETKSLSFGHVLLTKIGQELAPICKSEPVNGFFEYVEKQWKAFLPKPCETTNPPTIDA